MRIMEPAFDSSARKRPVNLTLNTDLVDRSRLLTDNLSGIVEKLLAGWLEQQQQERQRRHRVSEAAASAWNTYNSRHGSIADEFSTL